ncbi:peroxiredoxin [Paenibacillus sp. NPDC056579]|uniref:peroxiredoxin n=1 Tax=unclassified Paenibacillus TaxID=185978 RepID=UPI001EF7961C|nr:peroxiredoxin [Paenibacillus sp. H1-7]ULL18882.1 peroxiredoxin [Paenibacillus sp. H1-7]
MTTASAAVTETVRIGLKAPSFDLPSTKNLETLEENVALEQYRGRWLMVFFWPFDFTYVCPTEIIAFSDHYDKFLELDCDVIGISVDSIYTHRAWINTPRDQQGIGAISYPMASDFKKETARAYGVLDEASGAAHRGLFIIDPEGILRYQVVTDMNVGRSVDETLRILEALQSGGLCPANWKKGEKTL